MNCDQTREQLQEYLDNALPESEARQVKDHLDSCAGCRQEFELLGKIDLALRDEPRQELPGDLTAAVLRRLGKRFAYTWWDVAAAAASVAIVLGLVWLLEPLLGTALFTGQSEAAVPPMAELLRIDVGGFTFSYADLRDYLMEGHTATSGTVAETAGHSLGGLATATLLVLSTLLAIGTNAVCYRQAHMKRLKANRV